MARARKDTPELSDKTRILILHGKDRFRQDQYLSSLRTILIKAHGGEDAFDTIRFDGAQGPRIVADVLDECRSTGLMQQHKLVVVDNADQLVKGEDDTAAPAPSPAGKGARRRPAMGPRELLENYAEAPTETTTLVLRAQVWRPGNLDKAVEKVGVVFKCEPMTDSEAVQWLIEAARTRHNTTIAPEDAADLVQALGTDLGRLDSELEKLAIAAGGKGQAITRNIIRALVVSTREDEFWAVQAALMSSSPAPALQQIRALLDISRHDPVPITFACVEMARKVHTAARGLALGAQPGAIIPHLRVFGYGPERDAKITAILNAARAAGPRRALALLVEAVNTDSANKSGLGEPERNLERLAVRFAHAVRP